MTHLANIAEATARPLFERIAELEARAEKAETLKRKSGVCLTVNAELRGALDALRTALWMILYADADNHIPGDLHTMARNAIDRADRVRKQAGLMWKKILAPKSL